MTPLVSLVTPFYNAMPYFKEYLASAAAQTWRPLELILVDDGSTDGSWDYLQKTIPILEEKGIAVYPVRKPHKSQAAAVNAALPLISGEYFTWCDADDRMAPESIEKKVKFLMEHPQLGMVRNDGRWFDGDTGRQKFIFSKERDRRTQDIFDALFRSKTYCMAGSYMLRTSLFFTCYPNKQIPLSPEGQNLQLLLPPASRSECGFLPDFLMDYCQHRQGHSLKKRSFLENVARINNFSRLRRAILPYCACDLQHYRRVDKMVTRQEKQRFYREVRQAVVQKYKQKIRKALKGVFRSDVC